MESMIPHPYTLLMVGINHRTSPLEVREKLAASDTEAVAFLQSLSAQQPHAEFMFLSTCNRVEIYAAFPAGMDISREYLTGHLAAIAGMTPEALSQHIYVHRDRAMAGWLFGVASSLDSMVLGETQILGQVKQAYQNACAAGTAGTILHPLCQRALAASKDVHENTGLSEGKTSVASVAVELIGEVFDALTDKVILVIGAGKMASIMLKHILPHKPRRLILANRTEARGRELGANISAEVLDFSRLNDGLVHADIVLSSTSSSEPVLTVARLKPLLRMRAYRPLFIIDVAVPRDAEEQVGKLPNTFLYNIDDLNHVAESTRRKRGDELENGRAIVDRHLNDFMAWLSSRNTGPVVKALYQRCRDISDRELGQLLADHPELTFDQQEALKLFAHRLVGKILHAPVTQLGSHELVDQRLHLAAAVKELFRLSEQAPAPPASAEAPADNKPPAKP